MTDNNSEIKSEKIAQLEAERKEIAKRQKQRSAKYQAAYQRDRARDDEIYYEIKRLRYVALIGVPDAVRLIGQFNEPKQLGTLKAVRRTRCDIQMTANGKIWDASLDSIVLANEGGFLLPMRIGSDEQSQGISQRAQSHEDPPGHGGDGTGRISDEDIPF